MCMNHHNINLDSCHKIVNAVPPEVTVVAASKQQSVAAIAALQGQGVVDFGENYLSELLDKQRQLTKLPITWHFIGTVQSNKCKQLAQHCDWVQSAASEKHLRMLNGARQGRQLLQVLLQVNIDNDPHKSGCTVQQAQLIFAAAHQWSNIKLRGIMVIPQQDNQQFAFPATQQLFADLQQQYPQCDTLSMGMSSDFQLALQHGATMVRLGTAVFSPRTPKYC